MFILAGLGNPTLRYRHTRHNAGFDAIDILAKRYGISLKKKAHMALLGEGTISGERVIVAKPQTYMNRSGESICSLLSYYNVDPKIGLIVFVDDIMLDAGMIRIRQKGSAGGHNGLKNIIEHCNTSDFSRIRIGVGKMPKEADQINYVTARPSKQDRLLIQDACIDAIDACELMLSGNVAKAMNDYNGKSKG